MKIVNTTPMVLKHQIEEAIAKAVADFRRDYPNNKDFTRKCILNMETMVNLLLSMQGGSLKKETIAMMATDYLTDQQRAVYTYGTTNIGYGLGMRAPRKDAIHVRLCWKEFVWQRCLKVFIF